MKRLPALSAVFTFLFPARVFACPFCADLVERGKSALQAVRFGEAVNSSVLLMLAVPFLLVLGFFLLLRPRK